MYVCVYIYKTHTYTYTPTHTYTCATLLVWFGSIYLPCFQVWPLILSQKCASSVSIVFSSPDDANFPAMSVRSTHQVVVVLQLSQSLPLVLCPHWVFTSSLAYVGTAMCGIYCRLSAASLLCDLSAGKKPRKDYRSYYN